MIVGTAAFIGGEDDMTAFNTFLGIDIAKHKFDVVLLIDKRQRHRVFDNSEQGFAALLTWLGEAACRLHACMEATGGFGDDLALFLHDHGIMISVVNPLRIKAYGQSELVRTKTDKADAGVIARFCRAQAPAPWEPLSPRTRELRALVRRCAALKDMRTQELQRRSHGTSSSMVAASIERGIAHLEAEIADINRAIEALIREDQELSASFDLLLSIPGVGAQAAAVMLGEVPNFLAFPHNKKITAYAGLNASDRQSGASVRGQAHISKIGNARLRSVLYMCALSARRYNPTLRDFAERLRDAGKKPKVILIAVARKLLVIAYGIMKTRQPFRAT